MTNTTLATFKTDIENLEGINRGLQKRNDALIAKGTTDIFGTDEFNVAMREHQTMQYKHGRLRYKLGETISDAFKGLDVDAMTEDEYDDVSAAVFEQHFKPLRELQAQIHAKEDQIIGMLHKLRDDIRVAA